MHIILEGVLSLHCKLVLLHCLYNEHYLTLKALNQKMPEFEYGYSEQKNIPRALDVDHLKSPESKITQSGIYQNTQYMHACIFIHTPHTLIETHAFNLYTF